MEIGYDTEIDNYIAELIAQGFTIKSPRECLEDMIVIYQPPNLDWLGYELSETNPYTFHHIIKLEHDGLTCVNNGAILTCNAHHKLNRLEHRFPYVYEELNTMFHYLNLSKYPPQDIYYHEIAKVLNYTKHHK